MNLDRLAQYYRDPSEMANHSLTELEELVQEYPFFTAGQLLLLKQYRIQNSSRYKKQHRKMLALAPDPVRAFLFTEGDAWGLAEEYRVAEPQSIEARDTGIDEKAHEFSIPAKEAVPTDEFIDQAHDIFDWFRFYAHPTAPQSQEPQAASPTSHGDSPPGTHPHLTENDQDYERELQWAASSDILNAPAVPIITQGIDSLRVKVGDEQSDPLTADAMHAIRMLAQASIDDEQLPASATLAEVFARQQEWDHAIAIYEQLILMNPEKLPIFAARIAEFKKAKS
jgi:hypothetical protein